FKLFDATGYGGAFASYVLPSLGSGLQWSTGRLNVDGTLGGISTTPPLITQAAATASSFVLTGTGGTPNWSYYVLAPTNVTLPTTQWAVLATNTFGPTGGFAYTNLVDSAVPQLFLRIQVQ